MARAVGSAEKAMKSGNNNVTIYEYECKECKEKKADYNSIHHVFGVDLGSNRMQGTCPCCKRKSRIRSSGQYTRVGSVSIAVLTAH